MILLLLVAFVSLFFYHQLWYRCRNLPPGPPAWPLIGNMLALGKTERWEDLFLKWKKEYGNIYTYWMGTFPVISVSEYKTAIQMFVKDGDNYVDRFYSVSFTKLLKGGPYPYGLIDSSGDLWREQRRFALRVLRDFGLGKNKMEERILDEVELLIQKVDKEIDSGIVEHDLHRQTDIAVGSVINVIVNGFRFSVLPEEEEKFHKLKELTEKMMDSFSDPLIGITVNSEALMKFPIIRGRIKDLSETHSQIMKFLSDIIEEHKKRNNYDEDFDPVDYVDAFLWEKSKADKTGEEHYFSEPQLLNVMFDLWLAGQETTSTTLTWAIAYLIRNPIAQRKLHEELDRVVGKDRLVVTADRSHLPYTNAVIMEVQRSANILAQNVPRITSRDVEMCGVTVPAGTVIMPQISAFHYDPEVFENPYDFNPDRFIDENGNVKVNEALMPFSLGKRACLGEGMARMELFLLIANLAKRYEFTAASVPPTLKRSISGISMNTKPYKCCVRRRD